MVVFSAARHDTWLRTAKESKGKGRGLYLLLEGRFMLSWHQDRREVETFPLKV